MTLNQRIKINWSKALIIRNVFESFSKNNLLDFEIFESE
jgi:hypothetical protein